MKLGQILLVAVTLAIAGCAGHVQKVSSGSCGGTPVENYSAVGLCSRHCFIPSDEAVLLTRAAQGDDEAYLLLRAYYWQTGDRAKSLMWTEKAIAAGNPARFRSLSTCFRMMPASSAVHSGGSLPEAARTKARSSVT